MLKKQTSNTFQAGIVQDLNPLLTPETTLTNALNATFTTMNGNENALLNDMGNCKVVDKDFTAGLPEGYTPVGTCELGGVIYIASYNPSTGKGQLGSFPSPEYDTTSKGGLKCDVSLTKLLEYNNSENLWETTNITSIITLLDSVEYNSGDEFYVYTTENSEFDKYLTNTLFTRHNNREEEFDKACVYTSEPDNTTNYDVFTCKWPGYLYLKTQLHQLNPITADKDVTLTSIKCIPEVHTTDKDVLNKLDIRLYAPNNEIVFLNNGGNSDITIEYGDGNTFTLSKTSEFSKEEVYKLVVTPIYSYLLSDTETILIKRNDLSYEISIDFSKVGLNIVSELWKYSKDDTGVNLVFDIQDYLEENWVIDDVQLEYISHRYLDGVKIENSIELVSTNVSKTPSSQNIITFSNDFGYTLSPFAIYWNDNEKWQFLIGFERGEIYDCYNLNGNFSMPKNDGGISWPTKITDFNLGLTKDSNDNPEILLDDGKGNYLYFTTDSVEYKYTKLNQGENTVYSDPTIITDSSGDYKYIISYNEHYICGLYTSDGEWYKFSDKITKSDDVDGIISWLSGAIEVQHDGDTYIFKNESGDTLVECYIKTDSTYIYFINKNNSSLLIKIRYNEGVSSDIESTIPNTNSNTDDPTLWEDGNTYTSKNWVPCTIDTRRFVEGIYKVTIPFSDTLIENSLYIVKISVITSNNESSKTYCIYRVLFTNGMYNDLFQTVGTDYNNFDNIAKELIPVVDWNMTSNYTIETVTDDLRYDNGNDIPIANKLKQMIFPKYIYDALENKKANEVLLQTVTIETSTNPYGTLDYGFSLSDSKVSLVEGSIWEFDSENALINTSDPYRFKIVDTHLTNFDLIFNIGTITAENYFRPVLLLDEDSWENLKITLDSNLNRVMFGSGTTKVDKSDSLDEHYYSRIAGFALHGGGSDGDGGGGYTYRMGNFPIARSVYGGEQHIIQGRSDCSANTTTDTDAKPQLLAAFGENSETIATKITEAISLEEGKIKFPNDDFTDNLRSSASVGSKYPLFIPLMLVNGQTSLFLHTGANYAYFSTYTGKWTNNFSGRFSEDVQRSKYRTLWIFGLTYIDGVYLYVPLNSFLKIYDGTTILADLAVNNKKALLKSNNITVGELLLSYLSSIYYREDSEKTKLSNFGYLSEFTSSKAEETEITHSFKTPDAVISGNVIYDGLTQILLQRKLNKFFNFDKLCTKYYLSTKVEASDITINYTYTNPKYTTYLQITERTIENYVYNKLDDTFLNISDTDSELWIRENNSSLIIPINSKEQYTISVIKPVYQKFIDEVNNYKKYYNSTDEYFLEHLSENYNTFQFVKDVSPLIIHIPNGLFRMVNNKITLDYDVYNDQDDLVLKWVWKKSNNSEASRTNRISTSDLKIFGSRYSFDSLYQLSGVLSTYSDDGDVDIATNSTKPKDLKIPAEITSSDYERPEFNT